MTPATVPTVAPYASIAPIYDRLVGDNGLEPIWSAFRESCRRYRIGFASAADIGCGTGRFLARLAARCGPDLPLFGVDRSAAMLAIARRRLCRTAVVLCKQEISSLILPLKVELITINFNTLNYLRDAKQLQSVLRTLTLNLTRAGYLIFDMFVPGASVPPLQQLIRLPGVWGAWNIVPLRGGTGATVRMHTCLRRIGGEWTCAREVHRQRWWPLAALEQWLRVAGLRVLGVRPVIDDRRPGPGDRWIQIVARRC